VKANKFRKKEYRDLLDELCPYKCKEKECFLKDVLFDLHPNPRLLTQIKCIHKFKKAIAKERNIDAKKITSSEALQIWIDRGYAESFAENYNEDKTFNQVYKDTIANS